MFSSTTGWGSNLGLKLPSHPWAMTHRPQSRSTPCPTDKTPSITKACLWTTCARHSPQAHTKTSNLLMKKNTQMMSKFTPNTRHTTLTSTSKTTTKKVTTNMMKTTMMKRATMTMMTMTKDTKVMLTSRQKKPSQILKAALQTRSSPSST